MLCGNINQFTLIETIWGALVLTGHLKIAGREGGREASMAFDWTPHQSILIYGAVLIVNRSPSEDDKEKVNHT